MMGAFPRRVGDFLLQVRAIIHEGVIPFTGIFLVECFLNEREYLFVGHFFLRVPEEEMDEDGADVGLDEGVGDIERESEDGTCGIGSDSW